MIVVRTNDDAFLDMQVPFTNKNIVAFVSPLHLRAVLKRTILVLRAPRLLLLDVYALAESRFPFSSFRPSNLSELKISNQFNG
jgi:hypothetical protein